jgi:hypothetical protein
VNPSSTSMNRRSSAADDAAEAMDAAAFDIIARNAGLHLEPEQAQELRAAYPLLRDMVELVRQIADDESEPALVFSVAPRIFPAS